MESSSNGQRVVVILGAGASRPAIPLAENLLRDIIEQHYPTTDAPTRDGDRHLESGDYILKALWECNGQPKNFERVLDLALTEADEFHPWRWDREAWLTAAHQAAQLVAIKITNALDAVSDHTRMPSVQLLQRIVSMPGIITIASLNWDDLPLDVPQILWYDGFDRRATTDPVPFDVAFAEHRHQWDRRLFWLHGSIHLNRQFILSGPDSGAFDFRWVADPRKALHGWVIGQRAGQDRTAFDLPIITGGQKTTQVFRRPFFDYWSGLYEELRGATVLVAIGYSGQDSHLNQLVAEALRANTDLRRVVWVGWDETPYQDDIRRQFGPLLVRVFGLPQYSWALEYHGSGVFRELRPCVIRPEDPPFVPTWACLTGVESSATPQGLDEWERLVRD